MAVAAFKKKDVGFLDSTVRGRGGGLVIGQDRTEPLSRGRKSDLPANVSETQRGTEKASACI